jgi:hypothetical protein
MPRVYYAISGLGWGRGDTIEAAHRNYVKWKAALETGDAKPDIWLAPEGTKGFIYDGKLQWYDADDNYTDATAEERVS